MLFPDKPSSLGHQVVDLSGEGNEQQITSAACGHVLTNVNAWTADGEWLVYDVRVDDNFTGTQIAAVHVDTGEVRVLYDSQGGNYCGVVTASPVAPEVVFMHSPEQPGADWSYALTRRRGMILDLRQPGKPFPLDAMNYVPPFTPGALRGGSHLHVFSPDGICVSFTYEDEVLARAGQDSPGHDPNQRNVGVAGPGGPVRVNQRHPHNHEGNFFSVIVTRTVANPFPGSDEISRAFDEGWIGLNGYMRRDGTRQRQALAFHGQVHTRDGRQHAEIFVADLPDSLLLPNDEGRPIEGTDKRYPAVPRGVSQRRLTFTEARSYPGVTRTPRHWPRSSPDGTLIFFLMGDETGRAQFWSVSPGNGALSQVSRHTWGVSSAFTCSPDGLWLGHIMDNSVFLTDVMSGRAYRLTAWADDATAPLPQACVFSPDGRWLAYTRPVTGPSGVFAQIFRIAVPFSGHAAAS
jgi:Protein of unknown function (DUF3748)/WD40-like Beta Propeller Repeat